MTQRQKLLLSLLAMCLCFLALLTFLHLRLQYGLLNPSVYNSYTRQALAWRKGMTHLPEDVPHLELAIYEGRYFVSFPPVPSVPLFFLSFIFQDQIPDNLLVMLYAFAALIIHWRLFLRKSFTPFAAAFWAFTICFSSSMLPLVLTGAVWYQAQVLAFLLTIWAIERMDAEKPFAGLLLYALAVGCRPFNALYGPLLIFLYLQRQKDLGISLKSTMTKLLPGILGGLLIAAVYAWYNMIRFHHPLEFGHNYLPEFSSQGGIQFSLSHLGENMRKYIFALPFIKEQEGFTLKPFGFSLFISNPVLILMVAWVFRLLWFRRFKLEHGLTFLFFILHLFALLLHRTFGGFQYGARYAVDLIPYALLFLLNRYTTRTGIIEIIVMLAGLALSIYGSLLIHL
ncbi:MAG: hypothetical protein ACOX62_00340 [Christensenellales bacterium]